MVSKASKEHKEHQKALKPLLAHLKMDEKKLSTTKKKKAHGRHK